MLKKLNLSKYIACIIILIMMSGAVLTGCAEKEASDSTVENQSYSDGAYNVNVTLEGGTGKATISSPAIVTVSDGKPSITVVWSSKNYDYMIVNDIKYINEAPAGEKSEFTFPIDGIPCDMNVIGDTTAMSTPHEIEYTIHISMAD